jgi:Tol biopolymer transport system component
MAMERMMRRVRQWIGGALAAIAAATAGVSAASAQDVPGAVRIEEAQVLSHFGGRPAFSPDGKKIAFVGKSYGDAYEIDLATRKVRNLTAQIPHAGVMRIQYLPNGDYLVTAPRIHNGANTRAHLEMWVLDKGLQRGLQPLGSQVFEGIAVSRKTNKIAWAVIEPELGPKDPWVLGFSKPVKHYVADVAYRGTVPYLANKREILAPKPKECSFIEPQDFRSGDGELIYSCMNTSAGLSIFVMGTRLSDGASITYFRRADTYAEVEGIAPDGTWTTVECGKQTGAGLPSLDVCRLELKENGAMTPQVLGTMPGGTRGVSNPVVSPDGRWIALQRSDSADPDVGAGNGVYLLPVPGR